MGASEHAGYKDFVWAIELNRLTLHLSGLWPSIDEVETSNFASDLRAGVIFVAILFMVFIPMLCSLVRVSSDMMLTFDNLQLTIPMMITLLKIFAMRRKRAAISSLLRMMAEDWMAVKTNMERNVMIRRAQTSRSILIISYVMMGCAASIALVIPTFGPAFRQISNLTDGDRPLPLQTYYFYDTDKSPQFEITLFCQVTTSILSALTYMGMDSLLALAILHICGQLENFGRQLADLNFQSHFDTALRNMVQTHQRLIRFANTIEDIFAIMMLGLVFYFAIAFCIFGFIMIAVLTDDTLNDVSFLRKCFGAFGVIIVFADTFLYCVAGEIMAYQCDAVYVAICNLEWYKLESRKGRTFVLLLMRTGESFQITAGSIIPLTMTSFCSLVKTSVGYISVLMARRG